MERYWRTQRVIFRLLFDRREGGLEGGLSGPENPLKVLILHRARHPQEPRKKPLEHDRIQIHTGLAQVV
jgi:hypothetical protein